jgi:hypothetical protein
LNSQSIKKTVLNGGAIMKFKIGNKEILFFLIFSGLVLLGYKINFSPVVGAENQFFTLFQFFGPIAGGFLGTMFGPLAVLVGELANFFLIGKEFIALNLLRLLPMIFAAWYFSSKERRLNLSSIIPLLAIAAFVIHPVGRQVWYFSLFWTIPLIARWLPGKLFSRSLGATFTAHSIGGAIWIWTVPMPAEAWIALIPVVIFERMLFAGGISISFVVINTVLNKLSKWVPSWIPNFVQIDHKYVFSKKIFTSKT